MALDTVNNNLRGVVVPTTFILDVAKLDDIDVNSAQFKELLVRLYQNLNRMCLAINKKTSGIYSLNQFVTSNEYFPAIAATSLTNEQYRPTTRIVIDFGILPNAGLKSTPHGINVNAVLTWVGIQGWATDPIALQGIPIPYASPTAANNIELYVDATNVNVITGSDRTSFTTTYIVLEFLTQ